MVELRRIRYNKGLSQIELSRISKVHPSRISLLESGSTVPTANEIKNISGALGMLPEEIFGLDPIVKRLTASRRKASGEE